jgi:hypothetical protein
MSRIIFDAATGEVTVDASYVSEPMPEEIKAVDSVSARQFRLQLRKPILPTFPDGIREAVLAFVAQQSGEVQDAFEYSGSFVRDDPVMQAGFAAMAFIPEQIDAFFLAASKL